MHFGGMFVRVEASQNILHRDYILRTDESREMFYKPVVL